MRPWQGLVGIALLLAAAMLMALYEFSVLGTRPAATVALLLGFLGGSTLGSSARKPRPISK